jgi:uncharacterized membrane protein YdbT with pleckstrin-like domain
MASYIEQSLGEGETVIARAHFHWLYALATWGALFVPGFALLVFGGRAATLPQPFALDETVTWAAILAALLFVMGIWTFLRLMIRRITTEIGVTSHRFVEKAGLFSLRSNEIALPNIEGVRVHQTFAGRIFGYGTVRIEGTGVDAVTTPPIADPIGFVRAIQTAREHQSK